MRPIRVGPEDRVVVGGPGGGVLDEDGNVVIEGRTIEGRGKAFSLSPEEVRFSGSNIEVARVAARSLFDKIDPNQLLSLGFSAASVGRFGESGGNFSLLEIDPRVLSDKLKLIDAKGKEGRFKDKLALTKDYNKEVAVYKKLGDRYRGVLGSFAADPSTLPPLLTEDFFNAEIDLTGMKASGIRDIAMIFGFMKILDPESTVREGEAEMVAAAQRFGFAARIIRKLLRGETLSNKQRVEILQTIRDTMVQKMKGYILTREAYSKIARAEGFDPDVVLPNVLSDLQPLMSGTLAEDATSDRQDQFERLQEAWDTMGGDPNDVEGFMGFGETIFGFDFSTQG